MLHCSTTEQDEENMPAPYGPRQANGPSRLRLFKA